MKTGRKLEIEFTKLRVSDSEMV